MKHLSCIFIISYSMVSISTPEETDEIYKNLKDSLYTCLSTQASHFARRCYAHAGTQLKKILKESGKLHDKVFARAYSESIWRSFESLTIKKIEGELASCYRAHRYDRKEKFNCRVAAGRNITLFSSSISPASAVDIEYDINPKIAEW